MMYICLKSCVVHICNISHYLMSFILFKETLFSILFFYYLSLHWTFNVRRQKLILSFHFNRFMGHNSTQVEYTVEIFFEDENLNLV